MSWVTIRTGMETRLATISGLKAFDKMPSSLPNQNVAVVLPGEPVIEAAGHGNKVDVHIRVVVRCVRATAEDAQAALDVYIWPSGGSSVQAAVEGGPTLGGAVDDVRFVRVGSYGSVENTAGGFQADIIFRAKVTA